MISYVAAVLAAAANASSNVLNRKAAREEPARLQFRLRMIADLLRRPAWLAAVAMMIVSFLLSALALGTGALSLVQPIIILELPMTLIGASWALGGRLGRREWTATVAMTAGVAGLLVSLNPQHGSARGVPATAWIIASVANACAAAAPLLAARAARDPARQAALLGVASGLLYGMTAAFTKGMTQQFTHGGIPAVVTSWQLYLTFATGILATWLLQNAYQAGRLAAAQPGISLADPVVALTWGTLVFGEPVRGGLFLLAAAVALAVVAGGVVLLSRSPVLAGAGDGERRDERPAARPGEPTVRGRR